MLNSIKYIILALLFSLSTLSGCMEMSQTATEVKHTSKNTISFEIGKKYSDEISTVYNPVVIGKNCPTTRKVELRIPKPFPFDFRQRLKNHNNGDSIHSAHIYLVSLRVTVVPIRFEVLNEEGSPISFDYKTVRFTMPSLSPEIKPSGNLTVKFYSKNELNSTYSTKYHYLEEGRNFKVIRRAYRETSKTNDAFKLMGDDTTFTILDFGEYSDDILFVRSIKKMKDHYLSTSSASSGKLYHRKNENEKWNEIREIQELPTLVSKIPLEFELEEEQSSFQSFGYHKIKEESIGKNITYESVNKIIGSELLIEFNNCKMSKKESNSVYFKVHTGFKVRK